MNHENGVVAFLAGKRHSTVFLSTLHTTPFKSQAVVGNKGGYSIPVDSNYLPIEQDITLEATGGILNAAAAFCTAEQPYGISGTTADAYQFVNNGGTFTRVAGSGLDAGVNGAAVAPVCGFV